MVYLQESVANIACKEVFSKCKWVLLDSFKFSFTVRILKVHCPWKFILTAISVDMLHLAGSLDDKFHSLWVHAETPSTDCLKIGQEATTRP
jgi:hypothetical protein